MRLSRSAVALAALGLVVSACGSSGGGGTAIKGTIKIGVDLPESGSESSDGIPTLNGVKFAVSQQDTINGFKLEVENMDDAPAGKHDPQVGASNVRTLIADSAVLGMVGPFNSSVAKVEIPIANQASLAMISPANTNPCLTKDIASCSLSGGYHPADLRPTGKNNYFRVAATDDHQGPALADYAMQTLNVKTLGVVDDNEIYGKGIADAFGKEFCTKGGTVVGGCTLANGFPKGIQDADTASETSFGALINSTKTGGGTAIYFGGTSSTKGCVIRNQMPANGMDAGTTFFLGGDGIVDGECIDDAAAAAQNMYGTVASADPSNTPSAKTTIDAFKKAYPNANDFGAYTIPAYSAAKILIAAIGRAISDAGGKMPTRQQVTAEVAKSQNIDTPLGPTGFDSNGDTTQQIIAIYKTQQNPTASLACGTNNKTWCWVFVSQVNFSGGS